MATQCYQNMNSSYCIVLLLDTVVRAPV